MNSGAKILLVVVLGTMACGGEEAKVEAEAGPVIPQDAQIEDASGEGKEASNQDAQSRSASEVLSVTDVVQAPSKDAVDAGSVEEVNTTADASLMDTESGEIIDGGESDVETLEEGFFDPGAYSHDKALFPLGVQSGDATAKGALLWTRYLGDAPLRLAVFADAYKEKPGEILFDEEAVVADGGIVRIPVDTLESYTNYRYCFYVENAEGDGGVRSPLGLLRTAPADDALLPVVFGATSCINETFKPYDTLEQAGSDDLDFFIFVGDSVYADGSDTLEDYRSVWASAFEDEGYQKLFRTTPNYATWDDHEVNNNWNPESIDSAQLEAATNAFFEFFAIREQVEPTRVWRSYRWGKTAEVFILDCRSERKSSEEVYISPEQMTWLKEGLAESDAVFKVIVNSVPITDMPQWYVSEEDRWEGFPDQRTEILDFIASEIQGVLWIAGDFHFGGVMKVGASGSLHENLDEVIAGPGAQFPNPLWVGISNAPSVKGQFPYLTGNSNYTRFTLNPEADPPSILVEFLTGTGSVMYSETLFP